MVFFAHALLLVLPNDYVRVRFFDGNDVTNVVALQRFKSKYSWLSNRIIPDLVDLDRQSLEDVLEDERDTFYFFWKRPDSESYSYIYEKNSNTLFDFVESEESTREFFARIDRDDHITRGCSRPELFK
jgi:hypothetical protein